MRGTKGPLLSVLQFRNNKFLAGIEKAERGRETKWRVFIRERSKETETQ
jgi:hypothetical protein